VFAQEGPQLYRQGIILVEKGEQGIRCVEAVNHHDDQRLHDQPIRISFGASPGLWRRLQGPG
jgi:hypothetical protein